MPSTSTDRIDGLTTSVAVKAPCRVATTANITLSGLQTIDGTAVVADNRVLVKNQTTASENGIYVVASTAWTRAKDFDGNRDVVQGTLIPVHSGSTGYQLWQVTNSGTITIGTTSLTFSEVDSISALADLANTSDATKGDALVGGKRTATGSSSFTEHQFHENRVINLRTDHGAVGTAGTDNATAFAAGVTALPSAGGELFLPAGTYDLGSVVALGSKQVRLVGEGLERSIIQVTGSAAAFSSSGAPYIEVEGVTIKRKSGNANTITNMLDLASPNQLRIIRCAISGANTADIKLTDGYNIEIENCLGTAHVGTATWLQCNGTAPTTVRTKGNELTGYTIGVDYGSAFGTYSQQDIFVNCSTGRKYNGGNTHVSIGTWAENALAGAYVNEVRGVGSVNVIEIGTRVSGANPPSLWNFTDGATRAQVTSLNGQSAGFLNYTHNIARTRVTKSAGQAIANVTQTAVTWNQESYDTDAMHDNVTNNSRITCVTPGTYRITATINYAASPPAGTYEVAIIKGGATILTGCSDSTVNGLSGLFQSCSVDVVLAATEYVEVYVWNNAGGATVANGEQTNFSAAWLGT